MSARFIVEKRDDLLQSLSTTLRKPGELQKRDSVRICSYNAYNLFDEAGDRPKSPEAKRALAKTILAINPDIIALAEVQSEKTLRAFFSASINSKLRGAEKYDGFVCLTGNDPRGINVALVTRLSIRGVMSFNDREFDSSPGSKAMKFSRDLLGVSIQMTPDPAHTYLHFAAHLKSKIGGATAEEKRRLEASEIIDIFTEPTFGKPFIGQDVLLTGDMNDDPDGRAIGVFNAAGLVDTFTELASNSTYPTLINASPTGRRKYQETRLDYLFASASIAPRVSGVTVHKTATAEQASDHYPISAILRIP